MTRRLLLTLVLALAGCKGCAKPEAPDTYSVERMVDPYEKVPARGSVNDLERAIAVVDFTAQQLNYGSVPARVLRIRGNEAWAKGLVLLLADGHDAQVKLAWDNLVTTTTQAALIPPELKAKVREAEGRVYDDINMKMAPDVLRREYLAEITWVLQLIGTVTPDAGYH